MLSSPLARALDMCRLAGYGDRAELSDALLEWDYGEYEGETTDRIREESRPGVEPGRDGCPGGETVADVSARVDPLVSELKDSEGDVALFAHGHVLRVLAARWVEMAPEAGARLWLATATISVLGFERETPVFRRWNAPVRGSSRSHARDRLPVRHDPFRLPTTRTRRSPVRHHVDESHPEMDLSDDDVQEMVAEDAYDADDASLIRARSPG